MPVTKPKVCIMFFGTGCGAHYLQKIETTQQYDGILSHLIAEEPLPVDAEVPSNLEILRRHLS